MNANTRQLQPTVILQLNSTQLPETRSDVLARTAKEEIDRTRLTLYPGEPNELQVRVENTGKQLLNLTFYLRFENSQPQAWFRGWSWGKLPYPRAFCLKRRSIGFWLSLILKESALAITPLAALLWIQNSTCEKEIDIAANSQQFIGLHFTLPDNFFEADDIISSESPTLAIAHSVILEVYWGDRQNGTLVGYRPFQIQIRPRSTYIHFLPALYRQVDFFERFLKIMEEAFDPALQTSDCLWAYLDPLTAPEALLPFLAHWVGWKLDPRLEMRVQRHLIRNAVPLYRWRGTQVGLRLYLLLVTGLPPDDESIRIHADLNSGFVLGKTRLGRTQVSNSPQLGGGSAYHFQVRLRPDADSPPIDEPILHEIIQDYKPAFSTYELAIEPRAKKKGEAFGG